MARSWSSPDLRLTSIVLKVSESCWNSSPVLMSERMLRSPLADFLGRLLENAHGLEDEVAW